MEKTYRGQKFRLYPTSEQKAEIEKTMDTINGAFEKLLDDLYREEAFEAAADAKVLKTVLTQDGFVQYNPFRPDSEKETD